MEFHQEFVPYKDRWEFEKVYSSFYSGKLDDMRWAAQQIKVWKSRVTKVHIAFEVTESCASAMVHDIIYVNKTTLCEQDEVCSLYSTALLRFVYMITEVYQEGAKGMQKVAAEMNIPSWLMKLRNESAHQKVVSLEMGRNGVKWIMKWLRKKFWHPQLLSLFNVEFPPEDLESEKIKECIQEYTELQLEAVSAPTLDEEKKQQLADALKILKCHVYCHGDEFINSILDSGLFLMRKANLELILQDSEKEFLSDNQNIYLPLSLENFWADVITLIFDSGHIVDFLYKLLQSQESKTIFQKKMIASWAIRLIKLIVHQNIDDQEDNPLIDKFKTSSIKIVWKHLFASCVCNPNTYTPAILHQFINNMKSLTKKQMHHVMFVLAIYMGHVVPDENGQATDLNHGIVSVRRLLKEKDARNRCQNPEAVTNNYWTLVDEDMSSIPLGTTFETADDDDEGNDIIEEVFRQSMETQESVNEDDMQVDVNHRMMNNDVVKNFSELLWM